MEAMTLVTLPFRVFVGRRFGPGWLYIHGSPETTSRSCDKSRSAAQFLAHSRSP